MDLLAKLQLKPGQTIALVGGVTAGADDWPLSDDPESADAVLMFTSDVAALTTAAEQVRRTAARGALCWVAYPKSGQRGTDLNRDRVVAALADAGVQPVRQVSVDDVWSALRFKPA